MNASFFLLLMFVVVIVAIIFIITTATMKKFKFSEWIKSKHTLDSNRWVEIYEIVNVLLTPLLKSNIYWVNYIYYLLIFLMITLELILFT